jgi:hypothetical protein
MAYRHKPYVPTELDGVIPVLNGSDGFVTYCTRCERRVNGTPWPRATLQAAVCGQLIHQRDCPKGA